jgi:membrane-bound serine protease (ClpP class)
MTYGASTGNLILLFVSIGVLAGMVAYVKYFPGSGVAQVFISKRTVGDLQAEKTELLDQVGIAQTNLRPSGTALINGQRVDVVTEGPLIERGARVKVVALEGLRVVVRAVETAQARTV